MPLAAPLGRRFWARAIDLALSALILWILTRFVPGNRLVGLLALGFVALAAYEALFVLYLRATPGKLAVGLRVAEVDRESIEPRTAWVRGATTTVGTLAVVVTPAAIGVMGDSLAGFVVGSIVVTVAGGFFLSVSTAPLRRGAADQIAGTIVVPFEAPDLITSRTVASESEVARPRPRTAWGPVATNMARRRARAARLDDSPVLVLLLIATLMAWTVDQVGLAIALAVVWTAAFVVDEAWRVARDGGTVGHRREGLVVVDEATGEAPTRGRSTARAVVLAVFWLFPPLLPVFWLWMQTSKSGRGPHDLVADTVVVAPGVRES